MAKEYTKEEMEGMLNGKIGGNKGPVEDIQEEEQETHVCPECGQPLPEDDEEESQDQENDGGSGEPFNDDSEEKKPRLFGNKGLSLMIALGKRK